MNRLGGLELTFDLCVLQRQLPIALELVRACPQTTFILDHCGVPDIAQNDAPAGEGFLAWQKAIRALAAEPNVNGKISGISAYAPAPLRNAPGLKPYTDTMLDAFGSTRLVWGGDWPVVNLGDGLLAWSTITRELLSGLTDAERFQILTTNGKPEPGMLHEIERRLNVPLAGVPFVGDSLKDLQAAVAAGARPVLVLTGKGRMTREAGGLPEGTEIFADLAAFAIHLVEQRAEPRPA